MRGTSRHDRVTHQATCRPTYLTRTCLRHFSSSGTASWLNPSYHSHSTTDVSRRSLALTTHALLFIYCPRSTDLHSSTSSTSYRFTLHSLTLIHYSCCSLSASHLCSLSISVCVCLLRRQYKRPNTCLTGVFCLRKIVLHKLTDCSCIQQCVYTARLSVCLSVSVELRICFSLFTIIRLYLTIPLL